MPKHVTLIGMMGAGKSSVAPVLAEQLGRPVYELDALIEKREGTISNIFLEKGEAYFRRVECDFVSRLMGLSPAVLSPGGGAFMWEATRKLLLAETIVVYLATSVDVLVSRLETSDRNIRPLLNTPGVDITTTIRDLLKRRLPYYEQAHYSVTTDFQSPAQIAAAILTFRQTYD